MDCNDDDDDDVHFEDLPEESDFVEELFLNFGEGINSMTFDGLIPEAKPISPINPPSLFHYISHVFCSGFENLLSSLSLTSSGSDASDDEAHDEHNHDEHDHAGRRRKRQVQEVTSNLTQV